MGNVPNVEDVYGWKFLHAFNMRVLLSERQNIKCAAHTCCLMKHNTLMVLPGLTGWKPEFLKMKGMYIPFIFKNSTLFPSKTESHFNLPGEYAWLKKFGF